MPSSPTPMVNIGQTISSSEPIVFTFQISPAVEKGRNVVKKRLLFVCLVVLWSLTLLAQTRKSPRTAHTTEKSAIHVPPDDVPLSLTKIFSNLGKSSTDLYFDHHGWLVLGPNSVDKPREFIGIDR